MRAFFKSYGRYLVPAALFVLGAAFTLLGIYRDEVATVLTKATAICQECIGIG